MCVRASIVYILHHRVYPFILTELPPHRPFEWIPKHQPSTLQHTAGGRMIGKKMADVLLDKKVLEFYKWDGNVNKLKGQVKEDIETLVATWSRDEKDECIAGTPAVFSGGGGINRYLGGPEAVAAGLEQTAAAQIYDN